MASTLRGSLGTALGLVKRGVEAVTTVEAPFPRGDSLVVRCAARSRSVVSGGGGGRAGGGSGGGGGGGISDGLSGWLGSGGGSDRGDGEGAPGLSGGSDRGDGAGAPDLSPLSMAAAPQIVLEKVGPGRYCSPRYRMPFNSGNGGSNCVG